MNLYICEKPSQGRDLARIIGCTSRGNGCMTGGENTVTWCVGHLLELKEPSEYDPRYKKWNLDDLPIVPEKFAYNVKKSASDQYKVIRDLVKNASAIFIATDYDREGEAIARSLLERFRYSGQIFRVCLTALDDVSIKRALNSIKNGTETEPLYQSALGRSRADWLVGMNLSRLFSVLGRRMGFPEPIQIGRVITPTVTLVVNRDLEIENFVPVPYYELWITACTERGAFKAKWIVPDEYSDDAGRCLKREQAAETAARVNNQPGTITKAETKRQKESAPLPFDLTSLQQYASKHWGYTAQKTLSIAQSLYETHKATTYPRTDSRYLPESQFSDVPAVFNAIGTSEPSLQPFLAGIQTASGKPKCFNTSKVEAHHAIIPTTKPVNMADLSKEEQNIYKAVMCFYVIQFLDDAVYDRTTVEVTSCGEKFAASGRTTVSLGFKELLQSFNLLREESEKNRDQSGESDETQQNLPPVKEGDGAQITSPEINDKMTSPPAHLTESTLLAAMEHIAKYVTEEKFKKILKETAGIGTPATRAAILESAINHNYLIRKGKNILSTDKAKTVIPSLPTGIKSAGLTAAWEQELDKIAHSQSDLSEFMLNIEKWIKSIIQKYVQDGVYQLKGYHAAPPDAVCNPAQHHTQNSAQDPASGTAHSKKSQTDGNIDAESAEAPMCPKCGKPMVRRKSSKTNSEFWGCSGFPTCREIINIDSNRKGKKTFRRRTRK